MFLAKPSQTSERLTAITCLPSKLRHSVGQTEDAGADQGRDIVEGRVPPLRLPGRCDGEPVVDRLLPRLLLDLHVINLISHEAKLKEEKWIRNLLRQQQRPMKTSKLQSQLRDAVGDVIFGERFAGGFGGPENLP